ncbi:hypothetical protein V6N11_070348 [Hibiscus sabdariffa]|uniref:MATH domain-containing protein n=1 Tax=Hibiscus sabdariffa TaxID=183260 RepID=A0ABR2QEQ9_9ROSI
MFNQIWKRSFANPESSSTPSSDNGSNSGSNLTNVKWRVEILKAVDDSKSQSMNVNGEITKVTWRIENFSSFKKDEDLCSKDFVVDGNKWRLCIFPKGNKEDYLTIYLEIGDSAALPSGWSRFVQYGFAVVDQIDRMDSIIQVNHAAFNTEYASWGTESFLFLSKLHDPKRRYLVDDACLVEAFVYTVSTEGLISCEFILETDSDKHKTKEADCDKGEMDIEQKHAALLAEQKEIFRSSKKMKMELEAVGKEWTGYEANAKAAEAEWGRLKDFISSIKGKI